jgi:hypothetical protein
MFGSKLRIHSPIHDTLQKQMLLGARSAEEIISSAVAMADMSIQRWDITSIRRNQCQPTSFL